MKKTHKGTPIVVIYTDKPNNAAGVATVCIPGTKMGTSRSIQGIDLRVRAQAAGQVIAGIISNFIENNPHLSNVTGSIDVEDREYVYPGEAVEKESDPADDGVTQLEELFRVAAELGITHSPRIGIVKLREKVNEAMKPVEAEKAEEASTVKTAENNEPVGQLVDETPDALK